MTPPALDPDATLPPDAEDLNCPVCDYALRGLPEPRCPECGYAFAWEELRERARRRQLWFYEHAGTLKSHLQTRWRSLRPWSFWSQIHAYSDANAWRLWVYRICTIALLLVVAMMLIVVPYGRVRLGYWLRHYPPQGQLVISMTPPNVPYPVTTRRTRFPPYTQFPNYTPYAVPATPNPIYPSGRPTSQPYTIYQYVIPSPVWANILRLFASDYSYPVNTTNVIWPVLLTGGIFAGLPLYWRLLSASVLKANVRPVHLMRIDAYSTDVLPLLLLIYVAGLLFGNGNLYGRHHYYSDVSDAMSGALIGVVVVVGGLTLRLWSALGRYVRFPHAGYVALAFGVIASLVWAIVFLQVAFP